MFGFRKRRKHRRPQDSMKQVGNVAGKAIATLLVGAVMSFVRRKK
jgi:ribosomal protein L35AE/L33A